MAKAPFWQELNSSQAIWAVIAPDGGLVQFFDKATQAPLAAFAVENSSDLPQKLRAVVGKVPRTAKQLQVKIVASPALSREIRAALSPLGVSVLKAVERAGGFEIRYTPKEQKIFVGALTETTASAPEPVEPKPAPVAAINRKLRAMIVDDSPTIRKILEKILASDPEIEVVASVGLPSETEAAIQKHKPDVITLDIHLPEMNGVELLKRYLPKYRVPTVMISSISMEEGPLVLNALEAGAVDYVQKPSAGDIATASPMIVDRVKTAARARPHVPAASGTRARVSSGGEALDLSRMIMIGSSTGGTEALKEVFIRLPDQIPPILVVQHIPSVFSKAFADRLNQLCPFAVVEGTDGEAVTANKVIIAPGGKQMRIKKSGSGYAVAIDDSEPVNRHKPSVDVLFDSVVKHCGAEVLGVILTGMGADGAQGLLGMRRKGCFTIGQDEASCVVYGMPQAAHKLGACEKMVSLLDIPRALVEELTRKRKPRKAG